MKEGFVHFERLVNLKNVKGLNEIEQFDGTLRLGALCDKPALTLMTTAGVLSSSLADAC